MGEQPLNNNYFTKELRDKWESEIKQSPVT